MPIPSPKMNEDQDVFISRCISSLHDTDSDSSNEQIVAICFNAWREHTKKASGLGETGEKTFEAIIHSIENGAEKNLATFYLMNSSPNRRKWGVTKKALEEALPTLLGKSLGCGPGYRTDRHYRAHAIPVGRWKSFDMPDGYALGTAEITDEVALGKLRRGEWGPISVVIHYDKSRSKIENGDEIVSSFTFDTVDFCDTPAFPQAGFMNFAATVPGEATTIPLELCASFYTSQFSVEQAPGSPGENPNPEEEIRKMSADDLTTLKQELNTLNANYKELKEGYDTLKAGLEKPVEPEKPVEALEEVIADPKIAELEAQVKVMTDERHAERLVAALDARTKAGLVKDQKAEAARLGKLDDETLAILTLDAGIITAKLENAKPTGPRLKYTEDETSTFYAAIDKMRDTLGFEPRTKEAGK